MSQENPHEYNLKSKRASHIIPASLREQHKPSSLYGPGSGRCQKPDGGRSCSGWGLTLSSVKGWSPCLAQVCRARGQSPALLGPAWVLRTNLSLDPTPSETPSTVPALPHGVSAGCTWPVLVASGCPPAPCATAPVQSPACSTHSSCIAAVTNASEHRASEPRPPPMKPSRPHWAGGMRRVVMTGNPTQQLSWRDEENHEQGCERGHVSHHAASLHRRQGFPNRDLAPSLCNIHPRLRKQPSPDAERCTGGHGSSSGSGTKLPAFESLLCHSVGVALGTLRILSVLQSSHL